MAERRHQAWEDRTIAQLAKDCHTSKVIQFDSQCQSEKAGTTASDGTSQCWGREDSLACVVSSDPVRDPIYRRWTAPEE